MKKEKLISVIVPVYNAERFLKKCVESLLNQTYRNIEIILVNDGSTDSSGLICDELCKRDCRINVIHQKNLGVSATRNNGIRCAKGTYIGFVDSDDYIEKFMYERISKCMEQNKCDVVYCDARNMDKNNVFYDSDSISSIRFSQKLAIRNINENQLLELAGSVWKGLYRKDIIYNHNIRFPEGLKFSEDRIFNLLYLSKCDSLYYCKEILYYRLVDDSTTVQRYHEDHFDAVKNAYILTSNIANELWNSKSYIKAFDRQFINNIYGSLNNYFYKSSTLSNIKKYKKLKQICNDQLVKKAISNIENDNIRDKFMRNKNYIILSVITKLGNIKNNK